MNIVAAKAWLQAHSLNAYLHLHTDPHQSEYLAPHWQGLAWLSGFTGSSGTLVIAQQSAALWTDARYHLQAEQQLKGSGIQLMKMGLPETPDLNAWLTETFTAGSVVGLDPQLISAEQFQRRAKQLLQKGITLKPAPGLLEEIWTDRPALSLDHIRPHAATYAGWERQEKISQLREKMSELSADYLLIPTLDDIAWLLNLRGSDIPYNPVWMSFVVVDPEAVWLFMDQRKVSPELAEELQSAGVHIRPYEDIVSFLASLEPSSPDAPKIIWLDRQRSNLQLVKAIPAGVKQIDQILPTTKMKACKNPEEQLHIRACHRKDGLALVAFLAWLDRNISQIIITEQSASDRLDYYRQQQAGYQGPSFSTIPGYGAHGAIVHYHVTPETDQELRPDGIFLLDSGGQYLDGTTDITRSIAMGPVSEAMKEDFTLVLKGHIALAQAVFPEGTQGVQLDVLARQYLWQRQLNYGHGTGHGVGYYLLVHEGPAGIGTKVSPQPALQAGMLLSNEPGMYRSGQYGIRIENLLLVVEKKGPGDFGRFLAFETVSCCPIDLRLVKPEMLTQDETTWLNHYHSWVRENLLPDLSPEDQSWLIHATREI